MEFQTESNDDFNPGEWNNAPSLKNLKQELEDATEAHEHQRTKIDEWLDNLHVTGSAKRPAVAGQSNYQPKLIRKQAEWRYAALSEPFHTSKDLFKVKPRTFEDVEGANQNSLLLNSQFTCKINKTRFIDEYVRAAVNEGTAIVKVAWEFEEEEVTEVQPVFEYIEDPEAGPMHEEVHQLMQQNPRGYQEQVPPEVKAAHEATMQTGISYSAQQVGEEEVTYMRTVKNQPAVEVCDYKNVIIDPSCDGDLDSASFIIYRYETSLTNLMRAGIYSNLDEINVKEDTPSPLSEPDQDGLSADSNFNFNDKPRARIVAYEYWGYYDIDDTGIVKPIVATWVGNTLIRMDESPCPDGKPPFIVVGTLPVKHSVYGEPDGELLVDNQKVIGAVTRGMIDIMGKSASGQQGSMKGALDVVNKKRYQQGKDYEYNTGADPRAAFHMHTYPEIPQSAQYMLQMQNLDAESMSGIKAFNQGINGGALGDVATAVTGALDAASKREMGILRRLAYGIEQVGLKVMQYNSEFLEDEEIVRITNDNFVAISRDVLQGEYDMIIDISTAEEDNVKAQELAFMLQTMGNSMDPAMSKIILRDIARLRKMPELAENIEQYQPQPDPFQQQMQQLEIMKAQAEIAKIESETAENYAQARQKQGAADKTDLDFIEQESGVQQERAKELAQAQAEGNKELKILEADLKLETNRIEELRNQRTTI